ncbi:MAG: hypothetical protein P4M07_22665 [Xanthobacteraceae bacterium]|nr:hypothetical protein [Xanthobacteraceae bacterium]
MINTNKRRQKEFVPSNIFGGNHVLATLNAAFALSLCLATDEMPARTRPEHRAFAIIPADRSVRLSSATPNMPRPLDAPPVTDL